LQYIIESFGYRAMLEWIVFPIVGIVVAVALAFKFGNPPISTSVPSASISSVSETKETTKETVEEKVEAKNEVKAPAKPKKKATRRKRRSTRRRKPKAVAAP